MRSTTLVTASFATLISACSLFTSWSDVMETWVGGDIEKIEALWGPPLDKASKEDGSTIYKYHREKFDSSCFHYWIVNEEGIITDFNYEGNCRPIG